MPAMTMTKIPILDLSTEIDTLWAPITEAVQRVLRSGQFILGPEVKAFEDEAADYLGAKHAVGCNSGTDALVIALRALGVSPGDEVITTSFSFIASAEGISMVGATPVLVDIEPQTFNLDPAAIEAKITPRTKAIIPVHLFGQAADMDAITDIAARHELKILEDTAQAFGGTFNGKKLGTIGDVGAFSFFPTKNLGAYGDGGLIATNDDHVADLARMLRVHGSKKRYHNEIEGYNSRLDALQAAILRVKLPHVDEWNALRRAAADRYDALLAEVPGVVTPHRAPGCPGPPGCEHVFHQYTVRITNGRRDAVAERMSDAGVGTMIYYPVPIHRLPVYQHLVFDDLPFTDQACAEVLSLPMWPQIDEATQRAVTEALTDALR